VRGFFQDFPSLVAVSLYEDGREVAAPFDAAALQAAGLSEKDLKDQRRGRPLPFDRIEAGEVFVENSTLAPKLPALTLAVPIRLGGGPRPATVAALVRLDNLLEIASRSRVFETSLSDASGRLLAHSRPDRVVRGSPSPCRPRSAVSIPARAPA
jgi:hypothetical protein